MICEIPWFDLMTDLLIHEVTFISVAFWNSNRGVGNREEILEQELNGLTLTEEEEEEEEIVDCEDAEDEAITEQLSFCLV